MNVIVTTPPKDIRALSRQALSGRWGQAICVCLLALLLESLVEIPVLLFAPENEFLEAVASAYSLFMTGAIEFGMAAYFVHLFRSDDPRIGDLFEGFHYLLKAVLLSVVCQLITILWGLLFIIPGIIAMYRHSMAFHILDDDPSKGVWQCIRESEEMMRGNKLQLFLTDLSFLGWLILASIPASLLGTFYVRANGMLTTQELLLREYSDPKFQLLSLLCSLAILPVQAYHHTARACFYDFLNGSLVPAGGDV